MAGKKYTVVLDIVGLEYDQVANGNLSNIAKIAEEGQLAKMEPVFPAVTSTVQASVLSGVNPSQHGIIANGLYDRDTYSVSFWEQPSKLVQCDRVWDVAKSRNPAFKTAVLFWQNTMYAQSDIIVTPRPLHTDTEMILWCYSKPVGYYEQLKEKFGEFNLARYWGPLASHESSEWISKAVKHTLSTQRPDVTFAYIPHVDYSAQRFGKFSRQAQGDLKLADSIVGDIVQETEKLGIRQDTRFILFSEYSFNNVTGAVPLNLRLRDQGLVAVRTIAGKEYIDLEFSTAFAMVDHQVAHIYVKDGNDHKVRKILEDTPGVDRVLSTSEQKNSLGINHPRSGELIAISEIDKWFSYYWWYTADKAPDFATKVDIHRKPGYDPVELFFDPKTRSIPLETGLVKGSHGRPPNIETNEGISTFISDTVVDGVGPSIKCTDLASIILNA